MLRLTRVTDYGILLMTSMVSSREKPVTSNELSGLTHVPAPTVSKILQNLLSAGLVESVRGARGGYRLARDAQAINLRDIIQCLEGTIALTTCNLEENDCDQLSVCSTVHNWKRINVAIQEALGSISLEDMASDDFAPSFQLKRMIPIQSGAPVMVRPGCQSAPQAVQSGEAA